MQGKQPRSQAFSFTTRQRQVLIGGFTTVQKRLPDPEPQRLSYPFRLKPSLVVISIKKKLS